MAIFASTTTSGYSDPLKAYSIKALEQRQRDLLQQQAQQPGITPENTQTPIQGFAHVANAAVDAMRQRRVDDAAASQRNELSQLIAGGDPLNPTPQAMAKMAVIAPDMYKEVLSAVAQRQQQREGFTHADAAAQTLFKNQQQAKIDEENRMQARPTDEPYVVLKRALQRGEITKDEFDLRSKQLLAPKASEQNIINAQSAQSIEAQSTLSTLDEAEALLNHPKGIHAGKGAGLTTTAGQWLPDKLTGIDPETQANTQRFNKIMGGQALAALTQMKGASSDKDVAVNFAIVNDPNETPANKLIALRVLKTKLAAYVKLHNEAITTAGGTAPVLPKTGGGGAEPAATADPMEGRTATGADGKQIIRRNGKWEPM